MVIHYDRTELYFLAARNNITGEEIDNELIGFKKPKKFSLKTLDDCLNAAVRLNGDDITAEGYVVVDGKYQRVKIKSPAYVAKHHTVNNRIFTAKRMAELFLSKTDFAKLAKEFPDDARIIKFYDWQFEEIKYEIRKMAEYARALYEEYDCDRAAVAKAIKDSPYAWAGFAALDNDKQPEEIVKLIKASKLERLIKEYNDNLDKL